MALKEIIGILTNILAVMILFITIFDSMTYGYSTRVIIGYLWVIILKVDGYYLLRDF